MDTFPPYEVTRIFSLSLSLSKTEHRLKSLQSVRRRAWPSTETGRNPYSHSSCSGEGSWFHLPQALKFIPGFRFLPLFSFSPLSNPKSPMGLRILLIPISSNSSGFWTAKSRVKKQTVVGERTHRHLSASTDVTLNGHLKEFSVSVSFAPRSSSYPKHSSTICIQEF